MKKKNSSIILPIFMTISMKKIVFILMAFILAITLVACENKSEQDKDGTKESTKETTGQIAEQDTSDEPNIPEEPDMTEAKKYLNDNYDKMNIDGSTSMLPFHQSLNDLFSLNKAEVSHSKTVEAFEKLISGENDILLGVDYSDELLDKAKNSGVKLAKKEITREAFVFLININNPVKSLTTDQIKDIYSGKITNWSEVGGDDAPIKAYQRNSDSGSQMRMVKFMGDAKLMELGVEYISSMGFIVEQIGNYDEGRYSIGYNFYTFTEKQYPNDEVILLNVNGIYPDDETIFNETYPVNVYNYIYYDENNASAVEFADNLYIYLMSGEGQKLISDAGYVNINQNLDRNKNIDAPYENDEIVHQVDIGFYNEEKGEYYDVDWETGELLVFKSFVDYVLRDMKYKDNEKARDFLTLVSNSDIVKRPTTATLNENEGIITLNPWFDATLDSDDFFNYKYDNMYYSRLAYYIDEDKYVLTSMEKDTFDGYAENGSLDNFSEYTNSFMPDTTLEFTKDDLKNLYMRTTDWIDYSQGNVVLNYFQPFK